MRRLVGAMGEMNAGIFELAGERHDAEHIAEYYARLRDLAVETRRPGHVGAVQPAG